MVTTRPPKTIVKLTALGPVANTDTRLLIYGLFQEGRVLAQDGSKMFDKVGRFRFLHTNKRSPATPTGCSFCKPGINRFVPFLSLLKRMNVLRKKLFERLDCRQRRLIRCSKRCSNVQYDHLQAQDSTERFDGEWSDAGGGCSGYAVDIQLCQIQWLGDGSSRRSSEPIPCS